MPESISETWAKLATPSRGMGFSAASVSGTNCWIFKDEDDSMGFLMSGVENPTSPPRLSNISFIHIPEKELHQGGTPNLLRNCLEVHLDTSCDSELLAAILDRMRDHEPSGRYSTELLLTVINQVIHLVMRPKRPPSRAEVIGAWGELMVLLMISRSSGSPMELQRAISCWESEGESRDIIDFRMPHISGGLAMEVKTSTAGRQHHINGIGQVVVPEGFQQGLLLSLHVRETDGTSGKTASDLVTEIEDSFTGDETQLASLARTLHSKLEARGACCYDDRFHFVMPDGGLRTYEMGSVPKPTVPSDVAEVEWVADLVNVDSVENPGILG